MKWLIHWKANRNYDTYVFFLVDIFVLNTPFSSPKISQRTSSEGGGGRKHWAVFFPSLKLKSACLPLNGTLCASLLVFKWLWGYMGRQDWVLCSNERALQGISLKGEFIRVQSGTGNPALNQSPQTLRVHACRLSGEQPAWLPTVFFFLLLLLLLLLWRNLTPSLI